MKSACNIFHSSVDKTPPLGPVSSVSNIPISLTVVGLSIFKIVFKHPFFFEKKKLGYGDASERHGTCKDQKVIFGNWFPLPCGSGAGTQVIGLDEASIFTCPTLVCLFHTGVGLSWAFLRHRCLPGLL